VTAALDAGYSGETTAGSTRCGSWGRIASGGVRS
jgi:hypothetical protein